METNISRFKKQENKPKEILGVDLKKIRNKVLFYRAFNHPLRQRILQVLKDKGSVTVTDLFIILRLEQSIVSQHLAILRRAGFVITERQGKFIYYSLDEEVIKKLIKELDEQDKTV